MVEFEGSSCRLAPHTLNGCFDEFQIGFRVAHD